MPNTSPPHGDVQVRDNVLILTVDNMLSGWPTYVIDFTVENPGPMKLLLCLKEPSKYTWNEDEEDQDSAKTPDPSVQKKRNDAMLSVDISSAIKQDEAYRTIPQDVDAVLVNLYGICKGTKITKRKIFHDDSEDIPWPPVWPRAFRPVSENIPSTSLHLVRTTPALVKAISKGKENNA